jgi:2-aminobenzoate-CoA ligase
VGRSKGTVHTRRDLLAVADTYGRYVLKPGADDIFIGSPPLAFTYALGGLVLFPMRFGASTALIEQTSPPLLLEGIQKFRATITITSPTAYRAMLAHCGGYDLTSLRKCVSAGETLPAATFNAWEQATGIRLMDGIGSTEMLHMFIGCTAEAASACTARSSAATFRRCRSWWSRVSSSQARVWRLRQRRWSLATSHDGR